MSLAAVAGIAAGFVLAGLVSAAAWGSVGPLALPLGAFVGYGVFKAI